MYINNNRSIGWKLTYIIPRRRTSIFSYKDPLYLLSSPLIHIKQVNPPHTLAHTIYINIHSNQPDNIH